MPERVNWKDLSSRRLTPKELRCLLRLLVLFDRDYRFPEAQRIMAGNLAIFASFFCKTLTGEESPIDGVKIGGAPKEKPSEEGPSVG